MKIKSFIEMEYSELEKLVKSKYGINYEVVVDEEWNNDEMHKFQIDAKDIVFDEWDENQWNEFLNGKGTHNCRLVLRHLIKDGELLLGEYLINVSW